MARRNVRTARDSDVNADSIVTLAAPTTATITGQRWRILKVSASYATAGGGGTGVGTLRITSGVTVLWELDVDVDGGIIEDFMVFDGLQCGADEAVEVRLLAGGSGVTSKLNVAYALEG